ncbi:MAG TPA: hypothetical protein VFM82_09995 [Flavobacteriaceae bacterium]|nr:hypothetical protein [Flavobacteriaceae bacterium]
MSVFKRTIPGKSPARRIAAKRWATFKEMRTIIKITIILLIFTSCQNQGNKTDQNITRNEIQNDFLNTEKETILINTERNNYNNYKHWNPDKDDFQILREVVNKAIQNKEFDFLKKPILKSVKTYYRQYIPYIDENGERIIKINAFCLIPEIAPDPDNKDNEWTKMNWKKEIVIIAGGGSCYWQMKINIDKKEYFNFMTNPII